MTKSILKKSVPAIEKNMKSKDSKVELDMEENNIESDAEDSNVDSDAEDSNVESDAEDSDVELDVEDSVVESDVEESDVESDLEDTNVELNVEDSKVESDMEDSDVSYDDDCGDESYDEDGASDIENEMRRLQHQMDGNEADLSDDADEPSSTGKKIKKVKGPRRENPNLKEGQSDQQYNFACVMGSLISKKVITNKKEEILSNVSKDTEGTVKGKKRKIDPSLEVIDADGNIVKVETSSNTSKKSKTDTNTEVKEEKKTDIEVEGKRHFPTKKSLDKFYKDASEIDVVKEKKLRLRATQGVINLFNELEKFNKQSAQPASKDAAPSKIGKKSEIKAITSDRNGLIDFLTHKKQPVDRSLFGAKK